MGLFQLIAKVWSPSSREEALDRVVRRATAPVVDLVGRTPLAMCTAEARGYIRARALAETRRQLFKHDGPAGPVALRSGSARGRFSSAVPRSDERHPLW